MPSAVASSSSMYAMQRARSKESSMASTPRSMAIHAATFLGSARRRLEVSTNSAYFWMATMAWNLLCTN